MVFSSPKIVSKTYDVFRHIELWQSQTSDGASAKYLSYKTLFTDKSDDWRLYKEDGVAHNKYFISYKTARWDSNHGIPTHVYSYPEIIVGMVKQNLFIVISYTGYRDGLDYVHDINEDIVYVRDLLQTSIFPINAQSEAVPNPSGR